MHLFSRLLQVVGGAALVTGAGVLWGVGVALIVGGVCATGFGALLEREVG